LGDALEDVYVALDESLAELLAAFDGSSRVMVLLSHGIGPHYDGDHVLGEILARLDDVSQPRPRVLVARERAHRFLDRRRRAARGAVSVDGSRRFSRFRTTSSTAGSGSISSDESHAVASGPGRSTTTWRRTGAGATTRGERP